MTQLSSIPKKEQENMLSSFWMMLRECESNVDNSERKDPVLKLWVEQWYEQWNRVTGDNKEPAWQAREKTLGLSSDEPSSSTSPSTPSV